jgi:hypothetical protein
MAKLQFFKGAITGKLGEFVGSKWKGINYIKTFTAPANPRTENQVSIRVVFKKISLIAVGLFNFGFFDFFPPRRRMTERNQVFKANKPMFTNKEFVPANLQFAMANAPLFSGIGAASEVEYSPAAKLIGASAIIDIDDNDSRSEHFAHFIVYNKETGEVTGYVCEQLNNPSISVEIDMVGNQTAANTIVGLVVTRNLDGKKLISRTVIIPNK